MKQEEIESIHSDLYEALQGFDEFCRINHIRYYLICGTMLGAVRHQGFIPWDDDVDIGVPRQDYNRLLTLFGNKTVADFFVYNFQTDQSCSFDFTKLLHANKSGQVERKIFIDVFPLDGCPFSSNIMIRAYYRIFNCMRILKNTHYMSLDGKGMVKRAVVLAARKIPLKKWNSIMTHFLERHDFDSSKTVGNFSGGWEHKEIMKRAIYGEPTLIRFNQKMFYGVENPDPYLSHIYGDYMKIPPEEERLSHFT